MSKILVPNPLPAPQPGGGSPSSYQYQFNAAYYKSKPSWFQGFYYGRPQALPGTPLTLAQITGKADWFYNNHVDFDQEIEYFQWDPYATSFQRLVIYGYTRVPVGTGNTPQPPNVVVSGNLVGPAVPGKYLKVSCDINDFPPSKV